MGEPEDTPTVEPPGHRPGGASARALALVLLVLFSFSPVLRAGFVWDDGVALTRNPLLASPEGLVRIWTEPGAVEGESHYWPLFYTFFWLEARLWGAQDFVFGFHPTNLLLHLAAAHHGAALALRPSWADAAEGLARLLAAGESLDPDRLAELAQTAGAAGRRAREEALREGKEGLANSLEAWLECWASSRPHTEGRLDSDDSLPGGSDR